MLAVTYFCLASSGSLDRDKLLEAPIALKNITILVILLKQYDSLLWKYREAVVGFSLQLTLIILVIKAFVIDYNEEEIAKVASDCIFQLDTENIVELTYFLFG